MPKKPNFPYSYGGEYFTSKDAVRRFFRKIRENTALCEIVTNVAHIGAITDLLRGHIDHAEKALGGVAGYYVNRAPDHPTTTCFWIRRADGTPDTDFGIEACIQSVGTLNRQSLRALIRPAIYRFRDARKQQDAEWFISDFSGNRFEFKNAHVDHQIPFESIIQDFAVREQIDINSQMLTKSADACSQPTWKDASLAERFLTFHEGFPLRLVSKLENLSDIKRIKAADESRDASQPPPH